MEMVESAPNSEQAHGIAGRIMKMLGINESSRKGLFLRNILELGIFFGAHRIIDAVFHRSRPVETSTDPSEGEPTARSLAEGKDRWSRIMMKIKPETQQILQDWFEYLGGFKSYRVVDFKTTLIVLHTRPRKAEDEAATLNAIVKFLDDFAEYFEQKFPKALRYDAMTRRAVALELMRAEETDYMGFRVRSDVHSLLHDKARLRRIRRRLRRYASKAGRHAKTAGSFLLDSAGDGLEGLINGINELNDRTQRGLPDEPEPDPDAEPEESGWFARLVALSH